MTTEETETKGFVPDDLEPLREELKHISAKNRERIQAFMNMGMPISMDGVAVELLVNIIFADDEESFVKFWLEVGNRVSEVLDEVDKQVRLSNLTAPPGSGLKSPLV